MCMKKRLLITVISAGMLSCHSNQTDQPAPEVDSADTAPVMVWEAGMDDSTGNLSMKKQESDLDSLSGPALAQYLSNEHIKLEFTRISHDTVFIRIPDATYLTENMGSTGAMQRMAAYVYNFTELPGIQFVNFDFEEGDHAAPGTYNRDSFKNE